MSSPPPSPPTLVSSPPRVAAPADDGHRWFREEIEPHGPLLRNYLKGKYPSVRDVDDVVQESYLRIWKAKLSHPIASGKAFLFKVAGHLALDLIRRERISPISTEGDSEAFSVIEDKPSAADILTDQEKISLVGDAVVALPARTRVVIILHKFQGLSQAEVGRQLGLTEKAVEHQVARGIRLCEKFLRARGHDFF